jgi:small subunit ribosomal protein S4
MVNTQKRYKPLYKKFIRLRVNPLNNNKVFKFKRQKWKTFLNSLKRTNTFYKRFKPYTHYNHNTSKFASQGNSYKKKFRNDLLAKKTFNYFYGGLLKKHLKTRMTKIYRSKEFRDPMLACIESFESRLDAVLYRSKFSYSIKNARQLISHKHIRVNNNIEKNKSYTLKQGDLIQIDFKAIKLVKANLKKQLKDQPNNIWPIPPTYLTINYNTLEIVFGDVKNHNFSTSFPFKLDINSIITNYYRH